MVLVLGITRAVHFFQILILSFFEYFNNNFISMAIQQLSCSLLPDFETWFSQSIF
jgi:hypothetical protein